MSEPSEVEKRIAVVEDRVGRVDSHVVSLEAKVDSLRDETRPVVDAMKTMEIGTRTIGRIGYIGEKFGRILLAGVACWLLLKFMFGAASWSDVSGAIARATGR